MNCLHPISVKNKYFGLVGHPYSDMLYLSVPCGSCINCQMNKRSAWVARNRNELFHSISAGFLTLTIADEYIKYTESGFPTLDYKELQKFFKRLRKKYGKGIKYFACGEYGSKSFRPHFHAIIYNLPLLTNGKDFFEFYRKRIEEIWKLGIVSFSEVIEPRIGYITKYIIKTNEEKKLYEENQIERPRLLVSRGIGSHLLEKSNALGRHNSDYGKSFQLPRYVLEKIRRNDKQRYYEILRKRKQYHDFIAKRELSEFPTAREYFSKLEFERRETIRKLKLSKNHQL